MEMLSIHAQCERPHALLDIHIYGISIPLCRIFFFELTLGKMLKRKLTLDLKFYSIFYFACDCGEGLEWALAEVEIIPIAGKYEISHYQEICIFYQRNLNI